MGSGKLVFDGRPGAETIAHIRENGRVTVLFNAFDGPPRILRLYGKGQLSLPSALATILTPSQAPSTRLAVRNMNSSFPHPSANPVHEPSSSSTSSKLALCASPYPALFFCSSLQVIRRADGQSHSTLSNLIAPSSSTGQPRKSARIASVVVMLVTRARRA